MSHIINHCKHYLFCGHLVGTLYLDLIFPQPSLMQPLNRFVLTLLGTPYYPLLRWFWLVSVEENGPDHECPAGDKLEQYLMLNFCILSKCDLVCKLTLCHSLCVDFSQHRFLSLQRKLKTEEEDWNDGWDDDGEGAGEPLEDVIGVLYDDGHKQSARSIHSHKVHHKQVVPGKIQTE